VIHVASWPYQADEQPPGKRRELRPHHRTNLTNSLSLPSHSRMVVPNRTHGPACRFRTGCTAATVNVGADFRTCTHASRTNLTALVILVATWHYQADEQPPAKCRELSAIVGNYDRIAMPDPNGRRYTTTRYTARPKQRNAFILQTSHNVAHQCIISNVSQCPPWNINVVPTWRTKCKTSHISNIVHVVNDTARYKNPTIIPPIRMPTNTRPNRTARRMQHFTSRANLVAGMPAVDLGVLPNFREHAIVLLAETSTDRQPILLAHAPTLWRFVLGMKSCTEYPYERVQQAFNRKTHGYIDRHRLMFHNLTAEEAIQLRKVKGATTLTTNVRLTDIRGILTYLNQQITSLPDTSETDRQLQRERLNGWMELIIRNDRCWRHTGRHPLLDDAALDATLHTEITAMTDELRKRSRLATTPHNQQPTPLAPEATPTRTSNRRSPHTHLQPPGTDVPAPTGVDGTTTANRPVPQPPHQQPRIVAQPNASTPTAQPLFPQQNNTPQPDHAHSTIPDDPYDLPPDPPPAFVDLPPPARKRARRPDPRRRKGLVSAWPPNEHTSESITAMGGVDVPLLAKLCPRPDATSKAQERISVPTDHEWLHRPRQGRTTQLTAVVATQMRLASDRFTQLTTTDQLLHPQGPTPPRFFKLRKKGTSTEVVDRTSWNALEHALAHEAIAEQLAIKPPRFEHIAIPGAWETAEACLISTGTTQTGKPKAHTVQRAYRSWLMMLGLLYERTVLYVEAATSTNEPLDRDIRTLPDRLLEIYNKGRAQYDKATHLTKQRQRRHTNNTGLSNAMPSAKIRGRSDRSIDTKHRRADACARITTIVGDLYDTIGLAATNARSKRLNPERYGPPDIETAAELRKAVLRATAVSFLMPHVRQSLVCQLCVYLESERPPACSICNDPDCNGTVIIVSYQSGNMQATLHAPHHKGNKSASSSAAEPISVHISERNTTIALAELAIWGIDLLDRGTPPPPPPGMNADTPPRPRPPNSHRWLFTAYSKTGPRPLRSGEPTKLLRLYSGEEFSHADSRHIFITVLANTPLKPTFKQQLMDKLDGLADVPDISKIAAAKCIGNTIQMWNDHYDAGTVPRHAATTDAVMEAVLQTLLSMYETGEEWHATSSSRGPPTPPARPQRAPSASAEKTRIAEPETDTDDTEPSTDESDVVPESATDSSDWDSDP
jgi:hypothetical protein